MADDIGSLAVSIAMNDSSFQQGMQGLKSSMGVINSSFKESMAGIKDWGTNLDGLKANAVALGEKIDIQTQIVAKYSEQLQKSKENLATNSQAMLELKDKVDSSKTAWEESKASLGANDEATLKLKKDYQDLSKAYSDSESKVVSSSKSVDNYSNNVNNASGKLKSMYSDLGNVSTQLDKGEKSQTTFSKATQKLGINTENLKTSFGLVGIAAADYLKNAIESAGSMESAEASLTQTVKSTGDACGLSAKQLEDLATKEQGVTTFSKDTVTQGEAVMATFTNIGKNVFPLATQSMLDLAQKMGTTPAAAAKTLGKALNDPVGSLGALSRAGIQFSAGQKEQIKQMVKTGNTAGAQGIIIDQLNKKVGGQAAAAADTFAGKQKQMANELTSVKETIGTALLPVLTELFKGLAKILIPLASFVQQHPKFAAAVLVIIAVLGTLVGGLSVLTTVTSAFGIALDVSILPTIGLVVLALVAFGLIAYEIVSHWTPIKDFFEKLWKGIKTTTENVFNGIKTFFVKIFNDIKSFFGTWGTVILAVLVPFIGIPLLIYQHFGQIKAWLSGIWKDAVSGVRSFVSSVGNVIGNIGNVIKNGFNSAISFIKNLPGEALQWGEDFINGLINGIKGAIGGVINAVTGIAKSIGSILHFSVPDEGPLVDYESWMPDFMKGLASGITKSKSVVTDAVKNLAGDIKVGMTIKPNVPVATALSTTGTTGINTNNKSKTPNNYDSLIHADKIVISNNMDIKTLAESLNFYMKQKNAGTGGAC